MHRRLILLGSVLLPLLAAPAACGGGEGDWPVSGPAAAANEAGTADASPGRGGQYAGDATASSSAAGDAATTSPDAGDASPAADAGDASTLPDGEASETGTTDASDAGAPPTGTLLVAGQVDLKGVTSDGYVAYVEASILKVMPLAGGPAVELTPPGSTVGAPYIDRDRPGVVLNQKMTRWIGVCAWTAANGLRQITSAGTASGARALSPDGSLIAYAAWPWINLSSLVVAKTDGSNPVTVQSPDPKSFWAAASFASNDTLLLRDCDDPGDGGAYPCTLSTFVGPTFTRTLSVVGASESMVDPTGRWLWPGNQLYEIKTGAVVFSDSAAQGAGVFDAAGEHLFYLRSGGSLVEVATSSPTPTVLLPGGCLQIEGVSPDGTEILCRTQGTNGSVVVVGVATGAAAPSWPLFTAGTSSFSELTTDSSALLFPSGTDLYVVPAKGGASRLMVASAYTAPHATLIRGSRFLAQSSASPEMRVYDAQGLAPTSTLASHVQNMAITADLGTIAYVVDGAYAGLYVAPLP